MEALDLKPDDETYNQIMLAYAKNKNLEMVEKLNQEAIDKHGLIPTVHRYNNLVLVYAKNNDS